MAKTLSEVRREEKEIKKFLPTPSRDIIRELAPNQLLAAQLWAQGCYSKREIAEVCRMSMGSFCGLRHDRLFKREVARKQQQYDEMDKDKRVRIQNDLVKPIITELQKRIHLKKGLSNLKMTTLVHFLQVLNNETRLDTRDGVTSKVAHGSPEDFELDDIQQRHQNRLKERIKESHIDKYTEIKGEKLGLSL